jgi:hypothetical protein
MRGALTPPEEQAVLESHADMPSHERAHCHDGGLVPSDPQHREFIIVASEQAVGGAAHEKEILRLDAEAAHDAQCALQKERPGHEPFVEEMRKAVEVPDIVAFELEAHWVGVREPRMMSRISPKALRTTKFSEPST